MLQTLKLNSEILKQVKQIWVGFSPLLVRLQQTAVLQNWLQNMVAGRKVNFQKKQYFCLYVNVFVCVCERERKKR